MKFCDEIEIADGFVAHPWPKEITVERGLIETPPPGVQLGRKGAINITVNNGWAQYWRTEDVAGGWKYRLESSDYRALAA